ncbi:MAG: glycosyltransferase [Ruminococcus sp.]
MNKRGSADKRVFLCAERFFPRGDAGANRVLFIAKALQNKGWQVQVISIGRNDVKYFDKQLNAYAYEAVRFENIMCKTKGTVQKVERLMLNGKKTVAILKKNKLTSADKVYIYSSTVGYTNAILEYARSVGAAVATDVVEWHQAFQFKFGKYDPRYRSFMRCFKKLFVEAGNVIVISELLESHFKEKGCNVLKLPIYIEPRESFSYKSEEGKLNLIYPGNPYRKDSLEMMLEALNLLNSEEKSRVCLHLTGVTRQMLEQSVPGKEYLLDMNCVQIHGWIEYQELMELYQSIDFALIARPDNIVTRANFPSKVPELMNRGIPVIINSIGDIVEYLEPDQDAILIEETTNEACLAALRKCLCKNQDELENMHRAAFKSAQDVFDYRQSESQLDCFFSGI